MKLPWFRLYSEARTDAKLRSLTDAQHRVWFSLLCYASDQPTRGRIEGQPEFLVAVEVAGGDVELLRSTCNALGALHVVTCDLSNSQAVKIEFDKFDERQHVKPSDRPEAVKARVAKSREKKTSGNNVVGNADVTRCNAPVSRGNAEIQIQNKSLLPPTPKTIRVEDGGDLVPTGSKQGCVELALELLGEGVANSIARSERLGSDISHQWHCYEAAIKQAAVIQRIPNFKGFENVMSFLKSKAAEYVVMGVPEEPVALTAPKPAEPQYDPDTWDGIPIHRADPERAAFYRNSNKRRAEIA